MLFYGAGNGRLSTEKIWITLSMPLARSHGIQRYVDYLLMMRNWEGGWGETRFY